MRRIILLTMVFFLILSACRSKKTRGVSITKKDIDSTKFILPGITNVIESSFEFEYLSYKAKCDYKDPGMDQSFTMNLRMKRDSIIWISITAVGFEVARARLDKDSVKIINRLEKKYFGYDYEFIKKLAGTPLSLGQIQDLLTGNLLFAPYNYAAGAETVKFKTTQGYIENTITLDGKYKIIEQVLQHMVEQSSASVVYSEYKKTDKQQFPGKVDISVLTPNRNMNLLMENGGINTGFIDAFPFDIPSKYEKGN